MNSFHIRYTKQSILTCSILNIMMNIRAALRGITEKIVPLFMSETASNTLRIKEQ